MNSVMPRGRDWFPCLTLAFFTMYAFPALPATPGRGVYVNTQVHRIWVNSSGIQHVAGFPANPSANPANWVFTRAGDPQSSGWTIATQMFSGTNLAVFDNKIFFPYTSFDSGSLSKMHSYVAAFDLPGNKWISKKQLGSVHADNPSKGAGSGAAATVFGNSLYVFTDTGTYTSGDGVNWSASGPLVSDSRYQPIEAVTYYLPDSEPRILIIYGYITGEHNYWDQLYLATWNGTIGTGSDFPSKPTLLWNVWVYGSVSLQLGTLDAVMNSPAGPKTLSAQLFAACPTSSGPTMIRHAALNISSSGVTGTQSHTFQDGDNMGSVWTYNWYLDRCDTATSPPHQARQQIIVTHYNNGSDKAIPGLSDFLVPPKPTYSETDLPASQCGQWGGSATDTGNEEVEADAETYRKYWSLYGVILGSAPFAINEIEDDYGIEQLSNVEYGQDTGSKIQHSQSWENRWMLSAGLEVHGGLGHHLEFENQTDFSYQHGMQSEKETTSTVTTGWSFTLGTGPQKTLRGDALGRFGWGVFGIPKINVQDFSIYAYDYDLKSQSGTYLDQDIHMVEINPNSVAVKPVAFELANPGGPEDDYPGLFAGMQPFKESTNLEFWHSQVWETEYQPWTVKFGDGSHGDKIINPLTFGTGSNTTSTVSGETETLQSTGETQDIELSDEASVSLHTKLLGLKLNLKAGYDSSFTTKVTNTTSFGSELKLELTMAPCKAPQEAECVTKLTDQAYLLVPTAVATGQTGAPWLPAAYAAQLPWAITWRTTSYSLAGGTASGLSSAPVTASGLVVGGQGGTAATGETGWSQYVFKGAQLGWKEPYGGTTPLPMTAADFKPAKGIEIDLNGWSWSSLAGSGTWTRIGKVWLYESRRSVKRNKVFVKLDFGKGTWDLEIYRADLSGHLNANAGDVQATLLVNGKYSLKTDMSHNVEMEWQWNGRQKDVKSIEVTSYHGESDSATLSGRAGLEGTLPETFPGFGDLTIEMNGHAVHIPLLDHEDLLAIVVNKGKLMHDANGVHLVVDFARKTWTAVFEREAFHRLMAPVRGATTVKVRVGGELRGSTEMTVRDFTANLKLKG